MKILTPKRKKKKQNKTKQTKKPNHNKRTDGQALFIVYERDTENACLLRRWLENGNIPHSGTLYSGEKGWASVPEYVFVRFPVSAIK